MKLVKCERASVGWRRRRRLFPSAATHSSDFTSLIHSCMFFCFFLCWLIFKCHCGSVGCRPCRFHGISCSGCCCCGCMCRCVGVRQVFYFFIILFFCCLCCLMRESSSTSEKILTNNLSNLKAGLKIKNKAQLSGDSRFWSGISFKFTLLKCLRDSVWSQISFGFTNWPWKCVFTPTESEGCHTKLLTCFNV